MALRVRDVGRRVVREDGHPVIGIMILRVVHPALAAKLGGHRTLEADADDVDRAVDERARGAPRVGRQALARLGQQVEGRRRDQRVVSHRPAVGERHGTARGVDAGHPMVEEQMRGRDERGDSPPDRAGAFNTRHILDALAGPIPHGPGRGMPAPRTQERLAARPHPCRVEIEAFDSSVAGAIIPIWYCTASANF